MSILGFKPFKLKYLLIIVALGLVLSFGLHSIEFHHHHAHLIFGEGLYAILHTNDKKWWFFLLLSAIISIALAILLKQSDALTKHVVALQESTPLPNRFIFDTLFFFDPIQQALRRGILHPKICG